LAEEKVLTDCDWAANMAAPNVSAKLIAIARMQTSGWVLPVAELRNANTLG
jgi:hypothetical protein